MGDCRSKRGFLPGAFLVEMNPLSIACHFGKLLNEVLRDGEPIGHSDFAADPFPERVWIFK